MILLFPFSWKHSTTKCWKQTNLPHLSKNGWNPFPSFFLTTGQAELNCDLAQWCAKAMGCGGASSSNTPSYTPLMPVNHCTLMHLWMFQVYCAVFKKTEMHTQVKSLLPSSSSKVSWQTKSIWLQDYIHSNIGAVLAGTPRTVCVKARRTTRHWGRSVVYTNLNARRLLRVLGEDMGMLPLPALQTWSIYLIKKYSIVILGNGEVQKRI